jgi:hypothetical protein
MEIVSDIAQALFQTAWCSETHPELHRLNLVSLIRANSSWRTPSHPIWPKGNRDEKP